MSEHYTDIPKKARNGMKKRIESAIKQYGFEVFRKCTLKYVEEIKQKTKLQQEIEERERELEELKKGEKLSKDIEELDDQLELLEDEIEEKKEVIAEIDKKENPPVYKDEKTGRVLYGYSQKNMNNFIKIGWALVILLILFFGMIVWLLYQVMRYNLVTKLLNALGG